MSKRINKKLVEQYISMAKSGIMGVNTTAGVGALRNVTLKKNNKTVCWVFRYKGKQTVFAYSYPPGEKMLSNISEAGKIAEMLRREWEHGKIPAVNSFIEAYHKTKIDLAKKEREGEDQLPSYEEVVKNLLRPTSTWTFKKCIKKVAKFRTSEKQASPLAKSTIDDWQSTFRKKEFKKQINRPAAHLRRSDIEGVRDKISEKYGPHAGRKVMTHTSSILSYCHRFHAGKSGLEYSDKWWEDLATEKIPLRKDRRIPTLKDIARIFILAELLSEQTSPLSGNSKATIGKEVLSAFKFVILSGQRQGAAVQLACEDISERNGTMLASWGASKMKGKSPFSLPLPARLIAEVDLLQELGERNYVFAAASTKDEEEKHVNRSSTAHVCYNMRKKRLFIKNDIDYFSPHDVRRTIGMTLDEAGKPAGAAAILAHTIRGSDQYETPRVTEENYFKMQNLSLKEESINIWVNTILDEVKEQRREIKNGTWKPFTG